MIRVRRNYVDKLNKKSQLYIISKLKAYLSKKYYIH